MVLISSSPTPFAYYSSSGSKTAILSNDKVEIFSYRVRRKIIGDHADVVVGSEDHKKRFCRTEYFGKFRIERDYGAVDHAFPFLHQVVGQRRDFGFAVEENEQVKDGLAQAIVDACSLNLEP